MRMVKFLAALVLMTGNVNAEHFALQATAPIAWDQYDALSEYMVKSGECVTLSRYGQSPNDFPRLIRDVLSRFDDPKTRQYVPLMTYSCMISGDPTYGYYIPEHWAKKMPSY